MRGQAFAITNRSDLLAERQALLIAQSVLRALTSSGVVERFHREKRACTRSDWIVFKDAEGGGFAVRLDDDEGCSSPLQRMVRFVRHAHAIVEELGSQRALPCVLTLDREPPQSWGIWRLEGVAGTVWCAASIPVVTIPSASAQVCRDPKIRVRLYGVVSEAPELEVGARVRCEAIEVRMPEVGLRGRGVWKGEGVGMAIEINECDEVGEQQIPGVRLDLGEIEMRVSDLVGLRPGATINLGEVALERCFVRLGATVLAEGTFRTSEGQLLLTIDSVL